MDSLRRSWSRVGPSWTLQRVAPPPPSRSRGGGGGRGKPLPEGEEGGWNRKCPRPPAPRGLVGLLSVCNGDLTSPRVTHICGGRSCCSSRTETTEKVRDALMTNNFLLSKGGLPCESRWGSVSNTNSIAAFGLMFHHGLLRRVWERAYPTWASGSAGLDQEDPENSEDSSRSAYPHQTIPSQNSGQASCPQACEAAFGPAAIRIRLCELFERGRGGGGG